MGRAQFIRAHTAAAEWSSIGVAHCLKTFDVIRQFMYANGGSDVRLATTESGTAGDRGPCLEPWVRSEAEQSTISTAKWNLGPVPAFSAVTLGSSAVSLNLPFQSGAMMFALDVSATHLLNNWAGGLRPLDLLMIALSNFGVPLMVLAVAAQWWRKTDRLHYRHVQVSSGLAFLLGLGLNQLLLLFVHRQRPYDGGITHLIIPPSADFSFPSDHATAAFAIAAAFILFRERALGMIFLAAALLISVSRIYVGIHFASDVAGGAATGLIAALAVRYLYREGTKLDRFVTGIL